MEFRKVVTGGILLGCSVIVMLIYQISESGGGGISYPHFLSAAFGVADYEPQWMVGTPTPLNTTLGELWFDSNGCFGERLLQFNVELVNVRRILWEARGDRDWGGVTQSNLKVVWGNADDFFDKLAAYPNIRTVFLTWKEQNFNGKSAKTFSMTRSKNSRSRPANFLVSHNYQWVVSDPLCKWISTKGGTNMKYDAVHNRTCHTNMSLATQPGSLQPTAFNAKPVNRNHYWPNEGHSYPTWFYTDFPKSVLYIHIAEDALITNNGDFITQNVKFVPYSCGVDLGSSPPQEYKNSPLYDEVFTITHYWGRGYFHRMLEDFPRMVPYLAFLKDNPGIKIQVPAIDTLTTKIFSILGLDPSRAVRGVVRARIAYMPRATPCGFPLVQESQIFSQALNNYTRTTLGADKRNRIVLIRRSGHRHFSDRKGIEQLTRGLAQKHGLRFSLWVDNPVPPLEEGLRMFHEALMVVAPHGAGLSNILFSQPGTYVIEGVCNRPHVNLCYQRTAHILGHRYHGIPSRGGCEGHIQLTADDLKPILENYLAQITSTNKTGAEERSAF